jgi:hypothetical protein
MISFSSLLDVWASLTALALPANSALQTFPAIALRALACGSNLALAAPALRRA